MILPVFGLISASERHTLFNPGQGAQRRSLGCGIGADSLISSLGEAGCALARYVSYETIY